MQQLVTGVNCLTIDRGGEERATVCLPREAPLRIEVNGDQLTTLMRLPGSDRELTLGFLLTEGAITQGNDSSEITAHTGDPDVVRVALARGQPERRAPRDEPLSPAGPLVAAAVLMGLPALLEARQPVRDRVGVVHAAGVFDCRGEPLGVFEDVGRHNALYKALGHCLLAGVTLQDKVALITGRATGEMVTRAAAARLPVLCTPASATALGVQVAERGGLTLVARLGAEAMQVFSHPERIMR